jgi:hypothetical protein
MMGFLTRHCHFKGHIFKVGLVTVLGVINANKHLQHPHMFFMTVRHWQYYDWGTSVIISLNRVILLTSSSAKYCNVFKMWGCWMIKQRVAHKITNGWSARVTVMSNRKLNYSIRLYCLTQHFINFFTNSCDITCYNETEDYALDSECNIFWTKQTWL